MAFTFVFIRQKKYLFQKIKLPKINYCSKSQNNSGISIRGDIVGPPNPISNIRPIIFHIPRNETTIEKIFRHKREHIQKWHEEFWSNHNLKFVQERKEFEKQIKSRPGRSEKPLTADEMSVFYKKFLDKYWKTHFWYNVEWYKNNITLLILAFRVEMNRFKNKLINK
ncbi:cytochrome c oxidase assembly factor 8 isoform X2 [Rhodnius prolixus]|uniref:cytochrome c oxidase assembly factor 8 isoform X2 n=1 Tax=Rhodnius prolixus TaxID=13249 RepID=UPI003D188900